MNNPSNNTCTNMKQDEDLSTMVNFISEWHLSSSSQVEEANGGVVDIGRREKPKDSLTESMSHKEIQDERISQSEKPLEKDDVHKLNSQEASIAKDDPKLHEKIGSWRRYKKGEKGCVDISEKKTMLNTTKGREVKAERGTGKMIQCSLVRWWLLSNLAGRHEGLMLELSWYG